MGSAREFSNRLAVRRGIVSCLAILAIIGVIGVTPAQAFYYPPSNIPPGSPPNYNQIDTSYFKGIPTLPLPPPNDLGGFYIWVDSTGAWNVANHIYNAGNDIEHFHGSVLASMDIPPTPNVNIFATEFDLWEDTTNSLCYKQNDRWGWYQWGTNLYEIWWDVSTREYHQGEGDPNDFMRIIIRGCAIDFNVWSSGHGPAFGPDQVYLGGHKTQLSTVPGYSDTYPGITDPYQDQAPPSQGNLTIFTLHPNGTGQSYNLNGLITPGITYPCGNVLGQTYGARFSGAFTYDGNGIEFSSSCLSDPCLGNLPPTLLGPFTYNPFQCAPSQYCFDVNYTDPNNNFRKFIKLSGSGTIDSLTGVVCMTPSLTSCHYQFQIMVLDSCGAADTATYTVNFTFNSRPDAVSPANQNMFVCNLNEIHMPGFTATDPDNNLATKILQGGTLHGDTAYFTPVVGANTLRLIATDVCGAADTSVTVVTISVNHAPDAVSPANQNMFVCNLNEIHMAGFTATDIDGNLVSKVLQGGMLHGDTAYFTPVVGSNTLKLIATDACGLADTSITVVTIGANRPPDAVSPPNQNMFVCNLNEIHMPGFTATDPDNNLASKILQGGTLHGDTAYFTPVVGPNTLRLIATDACGLADTSITVVTIGANRPPDAVSPANQNMFVCNLNEIHMPGFTATDPDNNLVSKILQGGTLHGDTAYFTPVVGPNTLRLIATDACGLADTSITVVTIGANRPPDAVSPASQNMFVCNLNEIHMPGFTATDPDGNLASKILQGGTLHGDTAYFTPVVGPNTLRLIATDACGAADTSITVVTIGANRPPDAVSPANQNMFVCNLSEIHMPGFTATDPDGNLASKILQGGTLHGDTAYFTPVVGPNTLRLIATDVCGAADTSVTVVTITVNHAPDAVSPANQNMFVCNLNEIHMPGFTATDVDGNLTSRILQGGTLHGDTAYFTPVVGPNTLRLIATDACGAADTSVTVVTISANHAPVAVSPADSTFFQCALSQICLRGFSASDVDGNLVSTVLIGGTLHGDTACFIPVAGPNTLRLIATDACGAVDTNITVVTVNVNHAPVATSPNDTTLTVPNLNQICMLGFHGSDVDGNLTSRNLLGGVLHGDTACFTPVQGVNTLTFICTDACGAADTSITHVTVIVGLNILVIGGAPPEFTEEAADSFFIAITGGNPGSLAFSADFTAHAGNPSRYSATLTGSTIRVAITFDYLGEFSSAQSPFAYQVIVTDGFSADTLDLSLIVHDHNRIPTISSINDTTVNTGVALAFVVHGNDLDVDNTLSITKVSGPGSFTSVPGPPPNTGNYSWTPDVGNIGLNQVIFSVSDGRGGVANDTVNITVRPSAINLTLIGNPPVFTEEVTDSFYVALGGFDPGSLVFNGAFPGHGGPPSRYSATLDGNNIKVRATFDYLGEFSHAHSPFAYRLIAHDNYSADTLDLSLVVNDNNRNPEITVGSTYTVIVDHPLIFAVSANDLDSDNILTLNKIQGPGTFPGASGPSPVSANFTWTPTNADLPGSPYTVKFAVSDAAGGADTASVTVIVLPNGVPTIHIVYSPVHFREGVLDSVVFTGSDPDGNPLGGFGYKFLAPDSTFPGASFRMHADTAYLRLTFDYLGSWSSDGSPFQCRLMAYSIVLSDSVYLTVGLPVLNVNRQPNLIVSGPHTVIAGHNLSLTLAATDPDNDNLTLSATNIPPTSIFTDLGGGNGTFAWQTHPPDTGSYQFRFYANDGRGQSNSVDTVLWPLLVTPADTGGQGGDTSLVIGCLTGYPGADLCLPVNMFNGFRVGGFDILISYDPTVLNMLGVNFTARDDFGNEYNNVNIGAAGPGTVRVVYIADVNNGVFHGPIPASDGSDPSIFCLNFHVGTDVLFGTHVEVNFLVNDFRDNTVSDSSGYVFFHPPLTNGCVNIVNPAEFRGDPNMNCLFYEIADVVLVAQRLIYGYEVWSADDHLPQSPNCATQTHFVGNDPLQEASADLNGNGFVDVADLVRFINIINGNIMPPKLDPTAGDAQVSLNGNSVMINSGLEVGAVLVKFDGQIGTPVANNGMSILSQNGSVLVYSLAGNRIPAGSHELFTINGNATIAEVSVSDAYGRLMDVTAHKIVPIPTKFAVHQNYPNPFNARTQFIFDLEKESDVRVDIFNITGQLVGTLSGHYQAGFDQSITWDASAISSGIYFYRVTAGEFSQTLKMTLLK
jgi:hypothetical protein